MNSEDGLCLICGDRHSIDYLEFICAPCAVKAVAYEWISVNDKLPEHNQFFLGVSKSGNMTVLRCDLHINNKPIDYVFMSPDLTHQVKDITHWMPLPELPK